jgi:hypothetical protein
VQIVRQLFPKAIGMAHVTNISEQRRGLDVRVNLRYGPPVTIDFKMRGKSYTDFCLEFEHVYDDGRRSLGWVADDSKVCDYFGYVRKDVWDCWLLPRVILQRAWRENESTWREAHFVRSTPNDGYQTWWCAVPMGDVLKAINGAKWANQVEAKRVSNVIRGLRFISDDPREHYCECGRWGAFGRRINAGSIEWFCRDHEPREDKNG